MSLLLILLAHCGQLAFGQDSVIDGEAMYVPLWPTFTSSSWRLSSAAVNSQHLVPFVWLLPQTDPAALHDRFEAVSNPLSPHYMQYMTTDEIRAHIQPDASVVQSVLDYLTQHGVDTAQSVVDQGDSLEVRATVAQVESMFATTMSWYEETTGSSSRTVLRATSGLTIPASVASSTRLVLNLIDAPMPGRLAAVVPLGEEGVQARLAELQWTAATTPSTEPLSAVTPHTFHSMQATPAAVSGAAPYFNLSCAITSNAATILATPADFIQQRYNISSRQLASGYDGIRVGIIGGESGVDNLIGLGSHDCWSTADLTNIGAAYNYQQLPIEAAAPYARINDLLFEQQQLASSEATLDSQSVYLTSPTSSVSLLPLSDFDSFFTYFTRVLNMLPSQRPHVLSLSISYGSDSDNLLGAGFVEAVDSVLMQLGLVGVTVVVASGDDGASGVNTACTVPPPSQFGIDGPTSLLPSYPPSSPYVLSVGATDFSYNLGTTADEVYSYFTAQHGDTATTPHFCAVCSDNPNSTVMCQNSYVAEQAVSINSSLGFTSAGSARLHTHTHRSSATTHHTARVRRPTADLPLPLFGCVYCTQVHLWRWLLHLCTPSILSTERSEELSRDSLHAHQWLYVASSHILQSLQPRLSGRQYVRWHTERRGHSRLPQP